MRNMTIAAITEACDGQYCGPKAWLDREISCVVRDSREVEQNAMFAAFAGAKFDGHDAIPKALADGALCCLGERGGEQGASVIEVPSTGKAMQDIAAYYREQFTIPVVGITGSVGKTSAKEMISAVLSQRFCTMKTHGNLNNELGVPLTLFSLRDAHEAAVVEMGISDFGEMRRLTAMVRPDIAVFTAIGDAHLEQLGDRAGVLRAKSEILEGMRADGTVIVNGDDVYLRTLDCVQKKITFGMGADCDVRAEQIENRGVDGMFCVIVSDDHRIEATIPAFGEHMVYAALEGAAVGLLLGLSDEEIARGIASFRVVGSRARTIVCNGYTIVDDCYNANPVSVASGLRSISMVKAKRHVALLGDMLELGKNSKRLHYETGIVAVNAGCDLLITFGDEARYIAKGAMETRRANLVRCFLDREALRKALPDLIQPGDVILIKASHGMHFEEFTALLSEKR
ncbi:MAG: UDP-N-acetylmuramoyl-tripeptide--D-alanyl-D-alanine ligase [Oscillospiraceae bacterium]|jgi:UDP-N-acetylmuramoyl-tripeptide--D-alanyl-D-alanine ligase